MLWMMIYMQLALTEASPCFLCTMLRISLPYNTRCLLDSE